MACKWYLGERINPGSHRWDVQRFISAACTKPDQRCAAGLGHRFMVLPSLSAADMLRELARARHKLQAGSATKLHPWKVTRRGLHPAICASSFERMHQEVLVIDENARVACQTNKHLYRFGRYANAKKRKAFVKRRCWEPLPSFFEVFPSSSKKYARFKAEARKQLVV